MKTNIYTNTTESAPVIYLNVYDGDGSDVWEQCIEMSLPPVTLVVLSDIAWDEQLSPWKAEPVFKQDNFTGGADEYLHELVTSVIPEVEAKLLPVTKRCIAGYSLAGLFAAYAVYSTDMFDSMVSASGSFWFPGFIEYMKAHSVSNNLKCAYLSLGNKEHKVRNPVMSTVLSRTREAEEILRSAGVKVIYEENPGNHFTEPAHRTAKGIEWVLQNMMVKE